MRPSFLAATVAAVLLSAPVLALTQGNDPSETAAVANAPATAATPNPDDEIRCRRIAVTGSLIRRERVCKTVGEWRRLANAGNDVARAVVGSGNVCAGGSCGNGG